LPAVASAGDRDDVEIKALRRVTLRYERDFAEKSIGASVVTFGLEDLQALILERAAGGCFPFVGGLNDRDIGHWVAGHHDGCDDEFPERLTTRVPAIVVRLLSPHLSKVRLDLDRVRSLAQGVLQVPHRGRAATKRHQYPSGTDRVIAGAVALHVSLRKPNTANDGEQGHHTDGVGIPHAREGMLISYATLSPELFRRAAGYVDKILKGASPATLPVDQPTKFELVVNLKTARALGLTIPESVLLQADEVIR
jgi:hypothetical protein